MKGSDWSEGEWTYLMFQLEKDAQTPLYEQLYNEIKEAIIDGTIEEGAKTSIQKKIS